MSQSASYGVLAANAVDPQVRDSVFADTLSDAVQAFNASGAVVTGNDITNSSVRTRADGSPATLPVPMWGAIFVGANGTVQNNRLNGVGSDGLIAGTGSLIADNAVQNFCLVLNDCGAVHPFGSSGMTIRNNLLVDGRAATYGAPARYVPHAVGIYMDVHTSTASVTNNTLANADWGIHILDGFNNTLSGNLFYGNRTNQLWLQQRTAAINPTLGDVHGNQVRSNAFFPTNANPTVSQTSTMSSTAQMASYDLNRYSTLPVATIVSEAASTGLRQYTFPDWQTAVGPNGARGLESNGLVAAPMAGRAIGVMGAGLFGTNVTTIGTVGVNGWGRGGSPAAPTLHNTGCPSGIPSCVLAVSPAGSTGMMSSPKFAAVRNGWYRLSFDAAVSSPSQILSFVVRNAVTNATISPTLMPTSSTTAKRYSFVFQMLADAPVSGANTGARIDVQGIQGNQWVAVSNLQLSSMTAAAGDVPYTFIHNTSRNVQFVSCPASDQSHCPNYFSFADHTPVTWPARLEPLQAKAIFAPNPALVDSDNDGIADPQDTCVTTPAGAIVNNNGCSFGS